MARIGTSYFLNGLRPRFPLEMAVAVLGTFLGTALWFDLPNRMREADTPAAEKTTLQAPPLPIQMFRPSEEHQTSAFMEAVALSHVAPLRPESEIERAARTPPPAVEVMARAPAREKTRVADVPQPPPRPATIKVAALPMAPAPGLAQGAAPLRPPAPIPGRSAPAPERPGISFPGVQEAAHSARVAVTGSLDSLGRSFDALIHWR